MEEGVLRWSRGTYDCTLCGRCNVVCPVHINTRPLWIAMREQLVELGEYAELMDTLRDTVTANYNISGDPNENRLGWSANLEHVPDGMGFRAGAEVVYFIGCVAVRAPGAKTLMATCSSCFHPWKHDYPASNSRASPTR